MKPKTSFCYSFVKLRCFVFCFFLFLSFADFVTIREIFFFERLYLTVYMIYGRCFFTAIDCTVRSNLLAEIVVESLRQHGSFHGESWILSLLPTAFIIFHAEIFVTS